MNIRREKYKANRLKGMNQYNAARAAGYSESAAHKSNRIERGVKGCIKDTLEQAGLTDKYIVEKLLELSECHKIISCNIFVDKDGNMKGADGKSMDFIEVPDNQVRLAVLRHISNIKGHIETAPLIDQSSHLHVTNVLQQLRIARNGNGKIPEDAKSNSGTG